MHQSFTAQTSVQSTAQYRRAGRRGLALGPQSLGRLGEAEGFAQTMPMTWEPSEAKSPPAVASSERASAGGSSLASAASGQWHRARHRLSIASDLDALHGLLVATALMLLSGGLLYLGYVVWVWRMARRASCSLDFAEASTSKEIQGQARQAQASAGESSPVILLFGKHSPRGEPDADFRQRIERARRLAAISPAMRLLLLGGGPPPSEAEVARRALLAAGLPASVSVQLEDQSLDTLQNLRHARDLLRDSSAPIWLLSNRYHLARCALFAAGLGIEFRLCAAETRWRWSDSGKLLMEALYCLWMDVGRRWARLIGHQRMLSKVS